MTELSFDYETRSEVDLKVRGLDVYSSDPSTEILMVSYSFNKEPVRLWTKEDGTPFPPEIKDALADPHVIKRAFNAQFERVISRRVLGVKTPIKNWRCTMVEAYHQSFAGTLEDIGKQVGLPIEKQKIAEGRKLIRLFCQPQRVTKNQPFRWRDILTNPDEWERFCEYCIGDTVAEMAIAEFLSENPMPQDEWDFYELDQRINDRGLPLDMKLVQNAIQMGERRKAEILDDMKALTGLANPNSTAQLLPWLQERGYRFEDLQKDTVKKVLKEGGISPEAEEVLKMRQQSSRTSLAKYVALEKAVGKGDRFRFGFQFGGASRTNRFAGRRFQKQNLPRTPKIIEPEEDDFWLVSTTDSIRNGDYDLLGMIVGEHMEGLVGCIRSAIRAPEGKRLVTCDLSSIESVVIGWLSGCERLLNVFRTGKDAYKDFATDLYKKPYEEVTRTERSNSKPAVLGCGYRLGGGDLSPDGKRTGLWGYAESMGVDMPREEAARAVAVFREKYPEIVQLWYALENAVRLTVRTGRSQSVGPLVFEKKGKFLRVRLPSGRFMYYYKPRIEQKTYQSKSRETGKPLFNPDGTPKTYTKWNFSYEGKEVGSNVWGRTMSHGGKLVENFVQAIARDILKAGMLAAHREGFTIVSHVHDEIVTLEDYDNEHCTLERLRSCMIETLPWTEGMPLGAEGWEAIFYRK